MGTLSLLLPQVGQTNLSQEPLIPSDFTTIQTWANGNIDGANVVASLTGRRLLMTGYFHMGSNQAATTIFTDSAGDNIASGANDGGRSIIWAHLDPSAFAVTGKSNTQLILKMSLASNATAPAVNFTAALNAVTFAGAVAGNIVPTASAAVVGSSVAINTPAASTVVAAETSAFTFPAAGAYAFTMANSGTIAANNLTNMVVQLFALNS